MIRTTKNGNVDGIPDTWIFEYYCNLPEKLHGQTVIIKSLFKEEKTPSMKIYYLDSNYRFNDFSSGKKGGCILLVSYLFNLNFIDAIDKIREDFINNKEKIKIIELQKTSGFKVTAHTTRKWTKHDADFWTQFNIGSKILKKYNVLPLKEYTVAKSNNGISKEIIINGPNLYGYFTNSGELYKVYQPFRKKRFLQLFSYIQGSEQLSYKKPILLITSSLKDIMSIDSLNFSDIELVAPDSENTMIPNAVLSSYFLKYKYIYTIFDNDIAGYNAMDKYKDNYNISGIYLKMSKDPSDSIRDYGAKKVKQYLTPFIPKI